MNLNFEEHIPFNSKWDVDDPLSILEKYRAPGESRNNQLSNLSFNRVPASIFVKALNEGVIEPHWQYIDGAPTIQECVDIAKAVEGKFGLKFYGFLNYRKKPDEKYNYVIYAMEFQIPVNYFKKKDRVEIVDMLNHKFPILNNVDNDSYYFSNDYKDYLFYFEW